ncbi:MerR family transcriptional regulator [Halobacteriovorax sp. GB3]|uniref:MerR family transcriptional regulator n=1 Tax=Halobacteriovorax sp. GB3 TaxID=2719615 RepID=UPI00235F9AD3|nr:MerR family transcriptional regulator [Halobacteriovorax sp. GB3]MDD0851634.1 MerR family transcriptional regulator [Halobacteriovorax sp. GB3]
MKIKELEQKSGLTRDTIRYYEKINLLEPPLRTSNGYRDYNNQHLKDIKFIITSKKIGLTLEEIKLALDNMKRLGRLCEGVKEDLKNKKMKLKDEIKEREFALKEIDKLLKEMK